MKIYFRNPNTTTLKTLLQSLYSIDGYTVPTFFDENCTKYQCRGHRRSFEDLLLISKTYFSNTTKEELLKCLISMNMKFYFCSNINKIVFHFHGSFCITEESFIIHKQFNKKLIKGTYTPRRLLNILKKI